MSPNDLNQGRVNHSMLKTTTYSTEHLWSDLNYLSDNTWHMEPIRKTNLQEDGNKY